MNENKLNVTLPEMHKVTIEPIPKEHVPVEPIGEELPDITKFYIRNLEHEKFPLFVKENDELIINYKVLEPYLSRNNILFRVTIGVGRSGGSAIFRPSDIMIHVGGTTLTARVLNEHRDYLKVIEIRANEVDRIKYAHIKMVRKSLWVKEVLYDSDNK